MNRDEIIAGVQDVGREEFSRSRGPGGQNVNKVNTQVTLRVPLGRLARALGMSEEDTDLIRRRLSRRISDADELVIQVSDTRNQRRNREIAAVRAAELIAAGLRRERPRRPTRPSSAARQRRLDEKRRRSQIKRNRGSVDE